MHSRIPLPLALLGILFVSSGALFSVYQNTQQHQALVRTEIALATSTMQYQYNIAELSEKLSAAQSENTSLHDKLREEQDRNNEYGKRVESLASSVGILEKLSKTDRELLQKYSNVYFLSENFVPTPLSDIDPKYLYTKNKSIQIHAGIKPHLERLLNNSASFNAPLLVLSGYRSFGEQAGLKSAYSVSYGSGTANQFSADQGYSEHQLGSTVDFTTTTGKENLNDFKRSPGFAWLKQHAHEYGFILSYPEGNAYFIHEPWHWRFVGIELATKLHTEQKSFYDLDQRTINEYLVKIFD